MGKTILPLLQNPWQLTCPARSHFDQQNSYRIATLSITCSSSYPSYNEGWYSWREREWNRKWLSEDGICKNM